MFALADCNNFFVSCERVFRPDLIGKPVVVLSNNDGCVISRSNEAKALGIPMGAPVFKWKEHFKEFKVKAFSTNFPLYGDMSNRIMSIITHHFPNSQVYSIDEIFIKFNPHSQDHFKKIKQLKEIVYRSTGIPISIGIAKTKTLAKVANLVAKKFPHQTKGIFRLRDDRARKKVLTWLKVEDVWGIGRRLTKKLHSINLRTAFDFTQLDDRWIKKNLSILGIKVKRELLGYPSLKISSIQKKNSIAITRTFPQDLFSYGELKERIITFSNLAGEKLRGQKSYTTTIMVFLRSNFFKTQTIKYSNQATLTLPFPTNSSLEITNFVIEGLKKIFKKGVAYKRAGVIFMNFLPEDNLPLNLYQNPDPKAEKLMVTIDKINNSEKHAPIKIASQNIKKTCKMQQKNLSPRYTTKMKETILVY